MFGLLIIHLLLYPLEQWAYNSYFDKDERALVG